MSLSVAVTTRKSVPYDQLGEPGVTVDLIVLRVANASCSAVVEMTAEHARRLAAMLVAFAARTEAA